jgi:Protein of unknown function (DUF707)
MTNRFLLISRVGPQSLHMGWLHPVHDRGFDILLSSYDPQMTGPDLPGVTFEHRPGRKVAGYAEVLAAYADRIAHYDYVALFDDDLIIDSASVKRLFETVAALDLKIAQPALTHDSHFTYAALLQDRAFAFRYVNYIEMMCPVFRRDVLLAIRPLFSMGYESGIDLAWCNVVAATSTDFAVIDSVTVQHVRPVGQMKSENGFVAGKRYEDDIFAVLAHFELPWLSCVPYSGLRMNGEMTRSRLLFLLSALRLFGAIGSRPGRLLRARSVAVYWKHLVSRKPKNIRVQFPEGRSGRQPQ